MLKRNVFTNIYEKLKRTCKCFVYETKGSIWRRRELHAAIIIISKKFHPFEKNRFRRFFRKNFSEKLAVKIAIESNLVELQFDNPIFVKLYRHFLFF